MVDGVGTVEGAVMVSPSVIDREAQARTVVLFD
jgi:hypothetical protein